MCCQGMVMRGMIASLKERNEKSMSQVIPNSRIEMRKRPTGPRGDEELRDELLSGCPGNGMGGIAARMVSGR